MAQIKVGEILNIEGFDPDNVDATDLMTISLLVPDNGIIDEAIADELAAKFLHGADRCGDLLAQAVRWQGSKYTIKNKVKMEAALIRGLEAGYKTSTAQKDYVGGDVEFIKASEDESKSEAWRIWLMNKRETFIKWHHLCKSVSERYHQTRYTSPPNTVNTKEPNNDPNSW